MNQENEKKQTRLILHDLSLMKIAKQKLNENHYEVVKAVDELKEKADDALDKELFTVSKKSFLPPSNDKHDYMSVGPYWWKNPDTEDGLPYIRRDGERNPEASNFDRHKLGGMVDAVENLTLACFFLDEEKYAVRAVEQLEYFFINSETKMNPNLEFGQAIPGICEGRGIGIIDSLTLATTVIDSIELLKTSSALSDEVLHMLVDWFDSYLNWLINSTNGKDERSQSNNHGTAYDLQVVTFALFVGRYDLAENVLSEVGATRFAFQIEPDGSQPHELARTLSMNYSFMNTELLCFLAKTAERFDIDLWHFETCDGRSLKKAILWFIPFWTGEKSWEFQQIGPFGFGKPYCLLHKAYLVYNDSVFYEAMNKMESIHEDFPKFHFDIGYY